MSTLLRIEMLILALIIAAVVILAIYRKKLMIRYALIWLVTSAVLVFIAAFPSAVFFLSSLLGIETPTHLIYLAGILFLMLVAFVQTCILSRQAEQIRVLTQAISLGRCNEDEK